ncbi:MAG TPA: hypothetical protein VLJ39_16245 [Tepidisphaeraceae bacterium]|nr:hypothetical protein [Tepidisphaeraceae bacterium]
MNREKVLHHLDDERRRLAYEGEVIEVLPNVTRIHARDGSHYTVIHSSLTVDDADAAISTEIEHHRKLGVGFEWKVYSHDSPSDLRNRLAERGLQIGPKEAVMVCDLSHGPNPDDGPSGLRVVRVDRTEDVDVFRSVAEQVFAKDYSFTANQLAEEIRAGSFQHRGYIAYAGDTPVSIGRLYTHPFSVFGGLYGGGTVTEYRGKGYYRSVILARARDAAARGARYLIVDALPTSRPILERMGFQHLSDTWACEWRQVR